MIFIAWEKCKTTFFQEGILPKLFWFTNEPLFLKYISAKLRFAIFLDFNIHSFCTTVSMMVIVWSLALFLFVCIIFYWLWTVILIFNIDAFLDWDNVKADIFCCFCWVFFGGFFFFFFFEDGVWFILNWRKDSIWTAVIKICFGFL